MVNRKWWFQALLMVGWLTLTSTGFAGQAVRFHLEEATIADVH